FGMLCYLAANPSGSLRPGQAAANHSYVTRPRRSASEAKVSSNLNFCVSSLQNGKLHFLGDSTTPSSDTNRVTAKVRVPGNRFPPSVQPKLNTSVFGEAPAAVGLSAEDRPSRTPRSYGRGPDESRCRRQGA